MNKFGEKMVYKLVKIDNDRSKIYDKTGEESVKNDEKICEKKHENIGKNL